jgi:ferric iron reductase protein FhuF
VLDEACEALAIGGEGELCIEGPSLATRADLTAQRFIAWLGQLQKRSEQPHLLLDGERLLSSAQRPDGSRNPLYAPIRYVDIEHADGQVRPWRQRRMCCIRYVLPGVELCPNCPRLKRPPAV